MLALRCVQTQPILRLFKKQRLILRIDPAHCLFEDSFSGALAGFECSNESGFFQRIKKKNYLFHLYINNYSELDIAQVNNFFI